MQTPKAVQPTVLVVDDDPRNRRLVRGFLEDHYTTVEADSADTAVLAVQSNPIDLVLLDVMMPTTSGYEACQRIKALQGDSYLPVLMLTALDEQHNRNMGLEVGADDYLVKPIDRRELLLRVRTFTQLRQQDSIIRKQLTALHKLDALKDDLVSLIVHDLRNPLTGLTSLLHLARTSLPDGEGKQDLEYALAAAGRLNDAVDDLLKVRVLEEGRVTLKLQDHALRDIATAAAATGEGVARMQGVSLKVVGSANLRALVDRALVQRAVENLVVNSIRYSPHGGLVTVNVATHASGASMIEVLDDGPGIAAPAKERLFQKFGSVLNERPDGRRGFGLGLYLVQLVASAHHGSVAPEDRHGGGTCFRLILGAADKMMEQAD